MDIRRLLINLEQHSKQFSQSFGQPWKFEYHSNTTDRYYRNGWILTLFDDKIIIRLQRYKEKHIFDSCPSVKSILLQIKRRYHIHDKLDFEKQFYITLNEMKLNDHLKHGQLCRVDQYSKLVTELWKEYAGVFQQQYWFGVLPTLTIDLHNIIVTYIVATNK